jgi:iron complex transport system ATP-binding protein
MDQKILSVQNIDYTYAGSDWRLHSTSFSVSKGEIVGIIGPNGSGKSTLLKIASGILPPDSGTVFLQGRDISKMKRREIARVLGYFPQNAIGHFDYSVQEVVSMGRFPHLSGAGFLSLHDMEVVDQCLVRAEVEQYRDRYLSHLSGGERQRALLASVLTQEPRVLLLDEPTSALDMQHQAKFFTLLSELVEEGIGVVVVTHDLTLASLYSHRVVLLNEGRIIQEGLPKEILTERLLQEVYGEGVTVIAHPATGLPIVLPKTGQGIRRVKTI